jgi:hypothetical protein
MPVLSRDMEEVLRRSTASAAERGHGRATLEHLLLALGESEEGGALLDACAVDRVRLRAGLEPYLDTAPTTIPWRNGTRSHERRRHARPATRLHPLPVRRPWRGPLRERHHLPLLGNAEPCRGTPSGARHDAAGRPTIHR